MSTILDSLGALIAQYPEWSHAIIGAGMIIQGELTILLSLYLIISGNLTWLEFLTAGVGTLIVVETLVYIFGRSIRNTRFGWKLYYQKLKYNRHVQFYSHYLKKNLTKLFIIAKFLIGTNFILLLLSGWSRVRFAQFLKTYLLSVFVWLMAMIAVGYPLVSGLNYLKVEKIFRNVEIGIALILILILAGEYILKKILNKTMAIETRAEAIGKNLEAKIKSCP